jgi:hypothetical protein
MLVRRVSGGMVKSCDDVKVWVKMSDPFVAYSRDRGILIRELIGRISSPATAGRPANRQSDLRQLGYLD